MVSGSGSNLQALIDGADGYTIGVVISDRPGVAALGRAETAGIPTRIVPWTGDRVDFTQRVCQAAQGMEALILAGFMRVLGPEAIDRFPGRILNIHPSLLPAFPGVGAVEQALAHGVKMTGVSVHFVDELVDHGPIVAQAPVPVEPGDTVASLHARIQAAEHRLYPQVVRALATGLVRLCPAP